MPPWLQVITSLIAAVIGGIVAPQVSQAKDRRAARAAVREKVADVDALRWNDESYIEYRRAVAVFESAAILARVPRHIVLGFLRAVDDAREASETIPKGPDGEPVSVLMDQQKDEAVRRAMEQLSFSLWHPWVTRLLAVAVIARILQPMLPMFRVLRR